MQISNGTVTVTNGSATVVASSDVDWSDVALALQYGQPCFFMLLSKTEVPRPVIAVQAPGSPTPATYQLTLATPWNGATTTDPNGDLYLVHKDFTPNLALALPTAGEQGWAQLLARNMQIIDAAILSGGSTSSFGSAIDTTAGVATTVQAGKTLYASGVYEIPLGSSLEIMPGGVLEVG